MNLRTPRLRTDNPRLLLGLFGPITFVMIIAVASAARRDVLPLIVYHPTPATIDSVTVEEREGRRGNRYIPRVHFTYSVTGVTYHGTRVTPADLKGKRRWAERLIAAYQPGAEVNAYYNPEHPTHAFLRHSAGSFWGILALCGAWIGFATWSVVTAFRRQRAA